MKFKPTQFPLTRSVAKTGSAGWTIITGIVEGAINVKLAEQGMYPTYFCGKSGCDGSFNLVSKVNRPLVCPRCGSEIDWTGIATKKVKRCPDCQSVGSNYDTYCKFHFPAVSLQEMDEPL